MPLHVADGHEIKRGQSSAVRALRHVRPFFSRLTAWILRGPNVAPALARTFPLVPRELMLEIMCAAYQGKLSPRLPLEIQPGFPPDSLQTGTTGAAGRATLTEAYAFYLDCVAGFDRCGCPISSASRLLDFGVGWGRISRFFLNEILPGNLVGVDVDEDLISTCRRLFAVGRFEVCSPQPPTGFAPGSFDFVVGYSVMSHLSESTCHNWMHEFHRLLRPGGIAALTTRGRWFFDECIALKRVATEGYALGLAELFVDFEAAKRRFDSGRFVFASSDRVSGGPRHAAFYGEAFIPEAYARSAFLPEMELVEFQSSDAQRKHPIMFFRRCQILANCVGGAAGA
jgi:SAM-dependent methyltransferase